MYALVETANQALNEELKEFHILWTYMKISKKMKKLRQN